jgi:two-component system sensor histidine kinase QseC
MTGSIRNKLLLYLVLITLILWIGIAPWLYITIKSNVKEVLDDRLAASANMLATMVKEYGLDRAGLNPEDFSKRYSSQQTSPDSIACRVSRLDGTMIASSGGGHRQILQSVPEGYSFAYDDGQVWRVYRLSRNGINVTTAEKIDKRRQLLNFILIGVMVPLIFAVMAMLITVYFIIKQVFQPLTKLERQFASRSGNSLSPIATQDVPVEIRGVITEFNQLLERVSTVIENERRFTADAAHELRTPLAGISTQLQVAMIRADKDTLDSLQKAELAVKQLSQMLDQLLMLARLDSSQITTVSSLTDAESITDKALEPLLSLASQKEIVIKKEYQFCELNLPEELAVLALRNAIKNAIQFSLAGQSVSIRISANHKITRWEIEDTAGGVPESMLPSITQRFVHDRKKGNFGLGLSITKAIVELLQGSLMLQNTANGFRVTICLPNSSPSPTEVTPS